MTFSAQEDNAAQNVKIALRSYVHLVPFRREKNNKQKNPDNYQAQSCFIMFQITPVNELNDINQWEFGILRLLKFNFNRRVRSPSFSL